MLHEIYQIHNPLHLSDGYAYQIFVNVKRFCYFIINYYTLVSITKEDRLITSLRQDAVQDAVLEDSV